jgi:hypothetical protein
MVDLEKNTQEKKLFDPLKAKAQIQVYKEIYNLDSENQDDKGLRILKSASEEDMKSINKFFEQGDVKQKEK